jgi:hypothetical protein
LTNISIAVEGSKLKVDRRGNDKEVKIVAAPGSALSKPTEGGRLC